MSARSPEKGPQHCSGSGLAGSKLLRESGGEPGWHSPITTNRNGLGPYDHPHSHDRSGDPFHTDAFGDAGGSDAEHLLGS